MPGTSLQAIHHASELRPGMVVVVRRCSFCGRDHEHPLVAEQAGDWFTLGEFHAQGAEQHPTLRPGRAIAEGRLFVVRWA